MSTEQAPQTPLEYRLWAERMLDRWVRGRRIDGHLDDLEAIIAGPHRASAFGALLQAREEDLAQIAFFLQVDPYQLLDARISDLTLRVATEGGVQE